MTESKSKLPQWLEKEDYDAYFPVFSELGYADLFVMAYGKNNTTTGNSHELNHSMIDEKCVECLCDCFSKANSTIISGLPDLLNETDYNVYHKAFKSLECEELFTAAYAKNLSTKGNLYKKNLSLLDKNDQVRLWECFLEINYTIAGLLPKILDEKDYEGYLKAFKKQGVEELFITAYRKCDEAACDLYKIDLSKLDENSIKQLWDCYVNVNFNRWCDSYAVTLVSYYIYDHRMRFGRKGNALDDRIKGEYLVNLVIYLNQHSIVIRLRHDSMMDVVINQVNNIFDEAYFRKINDPKISDLECFFEAERKYCNEKYIDFLEYQQHRDHETAKMTLAHQGIKALAAQHYLWRIENNKPGDEKTDWATAERLYPEWMVKKQIAMICWNVSNDKNQHQDVYWSKACAVMDELREMGISYIGLNPHEQNILAVIKKVVTR